MSSDRPERRVRPRARASLDAHFETPRGPGVGQVHNLGEDGLFVSTDRLPLQGEPIELSITTPSGKLALSGLVWWTTLETPGRHHEMGFGVRLVEEGAEYEALLEALL